MHLNTIKPSKGAKHSRKRVGRGIGSGLGKTCGRGHKGQTSRTGGFRKVGFEGGQTPLQRRIPKSGFTSLAKKVVELRLFSLIKLKVSEIDLTVLKEKQVVPKTAQRVKVIGTDKIEQAIVLKGIKVSKGVKKSIEAAGGRVEE